MTDEAAQPTQLPSPTDGVGLDIVSTAVSRGGRAVTDRDAPTHARGG